MSQVTEEGLVEWEIRRQKEQEAFQQWKASWVDRFPQGFIVAQHEQNMYHDSYFSETIFDRISQEFVSVPTGSTAGGSGWYSSYLPWLKDASDEVKQAAVVAAANKMRQYLSVELPTQVQAMVQAQASQAILPTVGATVAVKWKTKGYPKGSEGQVFWSGKDKFGDGGARFGIQMEDGEKIFVNWKSLEVVDHAVDFVPPAQYEVSLDKISEFIEEMWYKRVTAGYSASFSGYGWRPPSASAIAEQRWMEFVTQV